MRRALKMSGYANITIYVGVGSDNTLGFHYKLGKEEIRHLSDFQDIGLIYLKLSSAIRTNPEFLTPAITHFENSMRSKGFQKDEIRVLLGAQSWEERMLFSWYAISEQARASSIAIDYDRYQNYWPNFNFCKEGWGTAPHIFIIPSLRCHY
jgi:hypothetical protein